MNFCMADYTENIYQNICRICLNISENMKDLFALTFPKDDMITVDFIRKITDLELQNCEPFPKNICDKCTNNACAAFEFYKMCIASDAKLRHLETGRILRKIETEALEEEISIKLEEPFDNDCLSGDFNGEQDPPEDPLACEVQTEVKSSPEELLSTTARLRNEYKCQHCSLCFNNKKKFQGHQKVHAENPFRCLECNQTFSRKIHLKLHSRIHIKHWDKLFSCRDCGKQFIYEYLLKQHEFTHKDVKPFPCTKCDKGCLSVQCLQRHMKVHEENYVKKTHICHLCDKTFVYPSLLSEHIKTHTGEKPFLCKVCGKGFRQNGALHFHERIHSGYKTFTCKICKENFTSKSNLKTHSRKHTKERPYVCDTCGASFRQFKNLKIHGTVHTGEKLVLCTICGKKMNTTGQLTVHLRSHTGEKPFSCQTCKKSFTTKAILVRHERIHSGECPFKCDVCGRAFNQNSTLKTHSKIHKQIIKVEMTLGADTKASSDSFVTPKGLMKENAELQKTLCTMENPDVHSGKKNDCRPNCSF